MSAFRRQPARLLAAVGALGALATDVLLVQSALAHRRAYLPADSAPEVAGSFGAATDPDVRIVMLGDSTAAGVGVTDVGQTVGGQLAGQLAAQRLHVQLAGVGVSGSRAGDLGPQVSRALLGRPDVAVLLVGANDATRLAPLDTVRRPLLSAVRRLRAAGVPVVLGCCPDMGAVRSVARPLRDLLSLHGRRVGQAQARTAARAGAWVVDLRALTGAAFRADASLLSADAFHPSAAGYAAWARALLPAVREATGVPLPQG